MRFTIKPVKGKNGKRTWRLEYRLNGERQRPRFKTKELAEAEQENIEKQVSDGGKAWLALTPNERIELMTVWREVKTAGKTLREVWEEYKRRSFGKDIIDKKLSEAFAQFMVEQKALRLDKRSLAALKSNVGRFVSPRASQPANQITRADVMTHLSPFTGSTFNSYRTSINTFFTWCVALKYAAESPVKSIKPIDLKRLDEKPPVVLHYDDCVSLFKAALEIDRGMIRYVAVCLQAGLRPEKEAPKLRPGDITDKIHVRGKTAKDRQARYVEIVPALQEWLGLPMDDKHGQRPALKFQGPQIGESPIKNLRRRFEAIRLKSGLVKKEGNELIGWVQDCMRHTFASAFYAVYGADRTIEALGHGDYDTLFGHYRRLMTKEEGQKILSITPAIVMASLQQSV